MSSSLTSNRIKLVSVIAISLAAGGAIIGLWIPSLNRWRHQVATNLRAESRGKSAQEAIGDYYASTLLEPDNQAAILTLASLQQASGDQAAAQESLQRLPEQVRAVPLATAQFAGQNYAQATSTARDGLTKYGNRFELQIVLSKAELEQGHIAEALMAAKRALILQPTNVDAQTLYGLAAIVAAKQGSDGSATGLVSAPEAVRRVERAKADKLALAQELYAIGLLNASKAVLDNLPPESTEGLKLKAELALGKHNPTRDDLTKTSDTLNAAIKLNPADASLWQLLLAVDNQLGDATAAQDAQSRLTALQAGRL